MTFKQVKTSELTGAALNWAVAKCEYDNRRYHYGSTCFNPNTKSVYETEELRKIGVNFAPSTNWTQGGPIIEREHISLRGPSIAGVNWASFIDRSGTSHGPQHRQAGPTPLIAAMRCYVTSKLGDSVEIPKELL